MVGGTIMKIIDFPINHNHIQARVDNFKEWLYQLDEEQLDSLMLDIEQYLLDAASNLENDEFDSTAPLQAAIKVSESRWWIAQI
jgi:hypothetical protein